MTKIMLTKFRRLVYGIQSSAYTPIVHICLHNMPTVPAQQQSNITNLPHYKPNWCLHIIQCGRDKYTVSQKSSVATCLRWGGSYRMSFVANFICFPAVQKFWKSVKIWKSYREFKGGNFLRHIISITWQPICRGNTLNWYSSAGDQLFSLSTNICNKSCYALSYIITNQ